MKFRLLRLVIGVTTALYLSDQRSTVDLLVWLGLSPCGPYTCHLSTRYSLWDPLDLILKTASRLYAFSAYPFRTLLPSDALGRTARTQEVRPSRSSRTREEPSQV